MGPGQYLCYLVQQGVVVARMWLRQRIPAHHTLGVFTAVKVQQLQIHRDLSFLGA
jgi:hypothetical protein